VIKNVLRNASNALGYS